MFGRKSEKTFHDDNQLVLEGILPELDEGEAAPKKPKRKRKRKAKRKVNRRRLPKHLRRVEETVEPESTACSCCGAEMERIGEDESEKLKVVPQIVIVIKYTYPKYPLPEMPAGPAQDNPGPCEAMPDHERAAGQRNRGACDRQQVRGPFAAGAAGEDIAAARDRPGCQHAGQLGQAGGVCPQARPRAVAGLPEGFGDRQRG